MDMNGFMSKKENLKVLMDSEIRQQFDAICKRQGLPFVRGIERLISFLAEQPELAQGMILKQTPVNDDLIQLVLKEIDRSSNRSQDRHHADASLRVSSGKAKPEAMPRQNIGGGKAVHAKA
jgi:antitoxin component of RelBE/YafQ-DinJ toxin-antitoxin module